MHVIGGRFSDLGAATAARDAILAAVAMAPADIAVRPLGTTQYDHPIEAFLLAGRFPAGAVATVTRLVNEHGGRVISSRVEWKARPRPTSDAHVRQAPARRRIEIDARIAPSRKRVRRPVARWRVRSALSTGPARTNRSGTG